ncbi:uncharacterized protein C17orf53 homolog isoform X4 [Mastomys coucha]|uniref:uncharacterized protein C17orf53 homolog isoform X4 n=1 Tax=Mastomys coucha TaxID=35658 RepID=UPI0012615462|nr:uncharacterized protein C17orf53 homolog isoform X4 [Mastomys coucha]
MTCGFQKLFSVEEDFEDEDFLSALENAENHVVSALPGDAGCLRPVSSRPQDTLQTQISRPMPSYPASNRSVPRLCLPTSSMPETVKGPPCTGAMSLRPVSVSSSSLGSQQRMTGAKVFQESSGPQSSATHSGYIFESYQQGIGDFEAPDQDEFDKALASIELEGAGLELEVDSGAAQILPAKHCEDPILAKKARVADLSGSFQKGPIVHCRNPWPSLRPTAATGSLPVPATSGISTSHQRGSPVPAPQYLPVAGSTIRNSPQNSVPGQPLQSPRAWPRGKPRFPGPQRPHCSSAALCQGPLPSGTPVSFVESPVSTPRSTSVTQPALQTPIVTNHLVQLVTATNWTPQQPSRPSVRAKTRRFPGPAGLLPHQHSGENLEEIMVSTPQTPTHGALAKFHTEIVSSSQGSIEEDFGRGPWLTMKSALGLDERDPTCFLYTYSIVMVLRKAALKQLPRNKVPNMAVMIKSLTRSTMDASVVFKDPTGEMLGTVHRVLLDTHQSELKPGSVLLLKQVGVFSPSLRNHYLNVTPNNLVHIYSLDSGDGDFLQPPQPSPKDLGNSHGSLQPDVAAEPTRGLRTAQNPTVSPEEELPETDDLDGLLGELPEDFFCEPSSWGCLKTGHPP